MKAAFKAMMVAALVTMGCTRHQVTYNVCDFGARGDGRTLNTEALNKAIRKCNSNGGGTVLVPPGTYITGTVVLLSHVNLHLSPGAVLLGSRDTTDYRPMISALFSEGYNRYGVIYAADAINISITGQGEINGQGTFFMHGLDRPHLGGNDFDRKYIRQGEEFMKTGSIFEDGPVSYDFRPAMLITLERCERVIISGVMLKDTPEWTMRVGDCDDVNIHGLTIITNPLIPNSDGIHVTTSRNVRISDCYILAGDDAVIVTGFGNSPVPDSLAKGARPLPVGNKTGFAENVTVTNCVLSSRSACIRVGYGHHPIRNLVFSNLVMVNSNRGIGIFARDNSHIENVQFLNIIINNRLHSGHWWGKGEPIHISALPDTRDGFPGKISNIRFSDITAASETGILVYGIPESIIENLYFSNIRLTITDGKYSQNYGGNFDLRPAYPVSRAIFKQDIPGLYAQHVKNMEIRGFELDWGPSLQPFFTHAVEIRNFKDILLSDFTGGPAFPSSGTAAISLNTGEHAVLQNCNTTRNNPLVSKYNVR